MYWRSLKRGGASLHIAYGKTYTNNLSAFNARVRTHSGCELALDLNPNLRVRNRSSNTYCDARELADRGIAQLSRIGIDDDQIIDRLRQAPDSVKLMERIWKLTIELSGNHSFRVRPQLDAHNSLLLDVVHDLEIG